MAALFKYINNIFCSLRTTIWLVVLLIAVFFAGALIVPFRREFQLINSIPFFQWLKEQPLDLTWWLWSSIVILSVIALNTVFCSIESLVNKRRVTQWLLLISPQIIHIGFLFILMAHLLSALGGFKGQASVMEGSVIKISDDYTLKVKDIKISADTAGYIRDWGVNIEYKKDGRTVRSDRLRPNDPSVQMGFNVNVKDLRLFPYKAALLLISREPGAVWALTGGILFMVGMVILVILKIKTEK
jgi:hypothetical protein